MIRIGSRHQQVGKVIYDEAGHLLSSGVQEKLESRGFQAKTLQEFADKAAIIFEARHHDLSGEKYGAHFFCNIGEGLPGCRGLRQLNACGC